MIAYPPTPRRLLLALAIPLLFPTTLFAQEACLGPTGQVVTGTEAFGCGTNAQATGPGSTAIGYGTVASFDYATAMGHGAQAINIGATALGGQSVASGQASMAVGAFANASADQSMAVGTGSVASALGAQAIGIGANATGELSMAVGGGTLASGVRAIAAGNTAQSAGDDGIALGTGAVVTSAGTNGIAIGNGSNSQNADATAVGTNAVANGQNSVALGTGAQSLGPNSSAIGQNSIAQGSNSVALGTSAQATGNVSTAIGQNTSATGTRSVALGQSADATATDALAVGNNAQATAANTVSLGRAANASQAGSMALGSGAVSSAISGIAVGAGAQAIATNAVALGANAIADRANTVSVGAVGAERQITNVAAGTADTDAVNVSQLTAVSDDVAALDAFAVKYDDDGTGNPDTSRITLAGAGGTTIGNLAAGEVSATSTEAINGAQLHGASTSIATAFGGGAVVNPDGSISAPAYSIEGGSYDNVGDAFGAVDTALASVTGDVGELDAFAVRYDDDGSGGPDTASITLEGPAGTTISNLGAGVIAAGSTQAVNGSQIFAISQADALHLGGGASVAPDGTVTAPSYVIGGTGYDNVGSALEALDTGLETTGAFAVQYDDDGTGTPDTGRITLAGAGGTTIGNLAAGVADDEAVNVGQLSPVVDALGGGAAIDPATGAVTGPVYSLDDGTGTAIGYTTVGDALGNLDGRVIDNTAILSGLQDGAALAVSYDDANRDRITLAGTDGTVIGNVAAGEVSATSMEAVNGAQLFGLGGDVATAFGGGASFAGGSFVPPTYVIQDASYTDVGSAFGAVDGQITGLYDAIANIQTTPGPEGPAGPEGPEGPAGPQGPEGPGGADPGAVAYDNDDGSSLTLKGAQGTRVGNVADGVTDTDAVNKGQMDAGDANTLASANDYTDTTATRTLGQANSYTDQRLEMLDDRFDGIDDRFHAQDRRIDRIGAMSGALTGMAMNSTNLRGPNRMAVGVGVQGGTQALAVGYQRAFDDSASISIGAAFSGSETTLSAGAGFSW